MVGAGQGFAVRREIEGTPNSTSNQFARFAALAREYGLGSASPSLFARLAALAREEGGLDFAVPQGKDVPSPESAPPGYVACLAEKKFEQGLPQVTQVDGTARTRVKDIDNLNELLSLFDEHAWLDEALFMYDGEIKSCMSANVMSLTMPPTPITGRSFVNSMGDINLYLDSGASRNMVTNPALLTNRRDPPAGTDQFVAADGVRLAVIGYGDIDMDNFRIPGVYLVRGLTVNLISVGDLASNHKVSSCFAENGCNLMLSDGRRIGGAIRLDGNQYLLRFLQIE